MKTRHRTYLSLLFAVTVLQPVSGAYAQQKIAPSGWVEDDAPAPNAVRSPAGKYPLQGGVQHAEDMAPLSHNLQTGSIYDEKSIASTADQTGWYEIPEWLSGKWLREEETIISTYFFATKVKQSEPRTIAMREIADFGVQRDRAGHVWHYRLASKGVADCGSYLAIAFVQTQEPLHVADDLVVVRDVFVEIQVNKETNVILHSSQAESITRYRPVRDGLIKTTMSVKVFKEDGTPYTVQKNMSFDKRIELFKATDVYKSRNMRQAFADFLRSRGQENLVPPGL